MNPGARVAQSLRFQQKPLASTQFLLGPTTIIDVQDHTVPVDDDALCIAQGIVARVNPLVRAVGSAETMLDVEWFAGRKGVMPVADDSRPIVWVNNITRLPASQLVERFAEVLQKLPIAEFDVARRRANVDHRG